MCRFRQRRMASKVCSVSFCFGQTTQPVTGKHQLSRGRSGGRVGGRRRGPCWINQSRQESPVIISIRLCLSVVLNNTAGLTAGPAIAIPRASSPLTISPQSATGTGGQAQPTPEDENEPVSVTITVKASGS